MSRNGDSDHNEPETAIDEVLREIEEVRPRDAESDEGPRRGEAGDATSPNTGAQEDAEGE
ncbi:MULTISPECIES: hypothetical protein [unclassified Streptomyces]|uniref:hypothetical protein n=1 Tax=unclassified Streptomyces TaxID=2593676 RepID=UPI00234B4DAB|nr:hypothetical protein [Streptomyces sp. M92]WCN04662.1 hypothetical protein M6G08_22530 [Streptomyces sp. M92]